MNATAITNPYTLEVKEMNFTCVKFGPKGSDKPTDEIHTVSWSRLRFTASPENRDREERKVFAVLLKEAEKYAAHKMVCRIYSKNLNGHSSDLGAHTWAAVVEGMGKTSLSGFPQKAARKALGSGFGQAGRKALADQEVKDGIEKLKEAGFSVNGN